MAYKRSAPYSMSLVSAESERYTSGPSGVTNWQNPFSSCRHTPFLCRSARFTLDALVCWRSRNSHIPATMSHPECRY